jgi:hypothetical protein
MKSCSARTLAGAVVAISVATSLYAQGPAILFQEGFDDTNLAARAWYDTSGVPLSTAERFAGASAFECRYAVGATGCTGGHPGRHRFQDTDSVYIAFYIKYSSNWVGSGKPYHPHMFYFLTNQDAAYAGPAYNYLTAYVEENGGRPLLAIQDGRNIDQSRIGQDLTAVTELRSVAGCNGDSDGYGNGECYRSGTVYWNSKKWYAGAVFFDSTAGSPRYKSDWHLVEAFFKLNTIVNGKAAKDGVVRYWYDGAPVIDHANVVLRTGAHPKMNFNQLLIAPYIGDGSPADQRFWVDNLMVATSRPSPPPPAPSSSSTAPAAPTNLRIVS